MAKRIAVGTLKGGTGKTMSVFNIAGVLAEKNKVLIIDGDPQCNLTSNAGVDITDPDMPSIRTIFENPRAKPEEVVFGAVIDKLPNLDLIPSSILLTDTEGNLASRSNRERLLENWFIKNQDFVDGYDYILLDTNPSMGLINQNIFTVSDSIILVTDVGFNSIVGAQLFVYLWNKHREDLMIDDNIKALIVNNSDKRIGLTKDLQEFIENDEDLNELLVLPMVPARVDLKRTEGKALPINIASPNTDAADAFRKLIENLRTKGAL